ncbi:MAG: N-acetyl-gamma-glutamyl-phosphate reductase, partial [Spirochaetales bacterium]|nr:N-acetyl-gamma-glutamyl-phosphate reductase [Spirochaetales bacterium]
ETRFVRNSNFVDIGIKTDPRTNRVIIVGAIDNLIKGAAGQAVQNMNLMFDQPEDEGINALPTVL